MTLATIAQGHVDAAEVLFLLAFLLFVGLAAVDFSRRAVEGALQHVAFALLALAFVIL